MKKDMFTGIGCIMSSALSIATIENVLSVISLVLAILTAVITLAFKLYDRFKKAKEDGKITPDEVSDIVDDAVDGIKEIKNNIGK